MRTTLVLLVVPLAAFGACGGGGGGEPGANEVLMVNGQRFDPESLTVSVGDTVTFTNSSSETHTVTAYEDEVPEGGYFASGGFASEEEAKADLSGGLVDPEETYEVTFDEPGTYGYFCIPHEGTGMTGEITVE